MTRPTRLLLAIGAALLCHGSAAVPPPPSLETPRSQAFLYELELGGYYSDNRARREPKDEAGFVLQPALNFTLFRLGSRIEAQARGRVEYYQWLDDGPGDDLRARLALSLDAELLPGLLYWTVQDTADVQPIDFLAPDSPDNLQQTNVFATGPSLRLRPYQVWSGLLEARYAHSYAGDVRAFNSERWMGSAWLRFAPHARRQFSLGIEASDVHYRHHDVDNPDFERIDAIARYRSDFRRLGFELAAGSTRIDYANGDELSGPLLRAMLRFDLSESHRLIASAVREYSDAVRELMSDVSQLDRPSEVHARPPVRAQQYRVRGADVSWRSTGDRIEWWMTPYLRDYDYPFELPDDPLSHRATGVASEVGFRLNPTQSVRVHGGYERREFTFADRTDRDMRLGVQFEHAFNQRWSLRTGVTRFDRDSDADGARYTENVLSVALVRHGGL